MQSLWHYVYERDPDWSYHKANDFQEHDLFLLIVEHGVHLEDPISKAFGPELNMTAEPRINFRPTAPAPYGRSLIFAYIQRCHASNRRRVISQICRRFDLISDRPDISPRTRYYMTGQPPQDCDSLEGFSRTAPHDGVHELDYLVVECLVQVGFIVNARDSSGFTALQCALEVRGSHHGRALVELDRIISLLEQNQHLPQDSVPATPGTGSNSQREGMPRGRTLSTSQELYFEYYTQSITSIPPSFGLFDDRRVAPGCRRIEGAGQTYYLDLITFISKNPSRDKNPISDKAFERRFPTYDE